MLPVSGTEQILRLLSDSSEHVPIRGTSHKVCILKVSARAVALGRGCLLRFIPLGTVLGQRCVLLWQFMP